LSQGQQHQQHQQQQQQQQQHQQQQLRGKNSWTSVALNRLYGLFYFRYELLYAQGEGRGANGEHLAATCCPQAAGKIAKRKSNYLNGGSTVG